MDLKASTVRPCADTVIEAQVESGRGPTATVIVQMEHAQDWRPVYLRRLRRLGEIAHEDDSGKPIKEAGPSDSGKSARVQWAAARGG